MEKQRNGAIEPLVGDSDRDGRSRQAQNPFAQSVHSVQAAAQFAISRSL